MVSPFIQAIKTRKFSALLEENNDSTLIKAVDEEGLNALHHAICNNAPNDFILFLLRKEVDPKQADKMGFTPLHLAALKGRNDIVTSLLRHNSEVTKHLVDIKDKKGRTVLDHAVMGTDQAAIDPIIETLTYYGAKTDIEAPSNQLYAQYIQNKIQSSQLENAHAHHHRSSSFFLNHSKKQIVITRG